MAISQRIGSKHRVDLRLPIRFEYNGKSYTGCAGDTVASALLSGGEPLPAVIGNYHAERAEWAQKQSLLPSIVREDFEPWRQPFGWLSDLPISEGMAIDRAKSGLFKNPAQRVRRCGDWPEPTIDVSNPPWFEREERCDLLVVGGGAAGLAQALTTAQNGKRVILADAGSEPGGYLLQSSAHVGEQAASDWVEAQVSALKAMDNVLMLRLATARKRLEDDAIAVVQLVSGGDPNRMVRHRIWRIKAETVALCTGQQERGIAFIDNDRPGIVLASFVQSMINRYGVALPSSSAAGLAFVTNNDSAYRVACEALEVGIATNVIGDLRDASSPKGPWQQLAEQKGIAIMRGARVVRTEGKRSIRSVTLATGATVKTFDCEVLGISGGWQAKTQLLDALLGTASDASCLQVELFGTAAGEEPLQNVIDEEHVQAGAAKIDPFLGDDKQPLDRQWVSLGLGTTIQDLVEGKAESLSTTDYDAPKAAKRAPNNVPDTNGPNRPDAKQPTTFILPIYQSGLELAVMEGAKASFVKNARPKLKPGHINEVAWCLAKGRWLEIGDGKLGYAAALIAVEGVDAPEFLSHLNISSIEKGECTIAQLKRGADEASIAVARIKAGQWQIACEVDDLPSVWAALDEAAQHFAD